MGKIWLVLAVLLVFSLPGILRLIFFARDARKTPEYRCYPDPDDEVVQVNTDQENATAGSAAKHHVPVSRVVAQ